MDTPSTSPASQGMPQTLRMRRPDRDARSFLRWFNLVPARFENRSVEKQRQMWRLMALAMGRRPEVESVRTVTIDGPGGAIYVFALK